MNKVVRSTIKTLCVTIILLGYIQCYAACEHGNFSGGDGTAENPYQVKTFNDLIHIKDHLGSCFIQMADIESSYGNINGEFTGVYDGNGKKLCFGSYWGSSYIFSVSKGTLRNIRTTGVFGICASNYGIIEYCENIGNIGGGLSSAGGIVCNNCGVIKNCINKGCVTGVTNDMNTVSGGICAYNYGTIQECANTGTISGAASRDNGTYTGDKDGCSVLGGIAGINSGVIDSCYNRGNGDVHGSNGTTSHFGGITGGNGHFYKIYNIICNWRGEWTGGNFLWGDYYYLVANGGIVRNCYSYIKSANTSDNQEMDYRGVSYMSVGIENADGSVILPINYNNYSLDSRGKLYTIKKKTGIAHQAATRHGDLIDCEYGDAAYTETYKNDIDSVVTSDWLKSDEAINTLNNPSKNGLNNPWLHGDSDYPYPKLRVGPIVFTTTLLEKKIGDNTPVEIKVSSDTSNFIVYVDNGVNSYNINVADGQIISISPNKGVIKLGLVVGENIIGMRSFTVDIRNVLNDILINTNKPGSISTVVVVNDANRYFEDNELNRQLIYKILGTKRGVYMVGNINDRSLAMLSIILVP